MKGSERFVLITGGAGFVGSNLAVRFKTERPRWRVVALDNLRRRGSELNLPRLAGAGVEFMHGDIRSPEDLALDIPTVGRGPDTIIECSAEPSVLAGYGSSPAYLINTNLAGTINCLESARRWGSDVVFLSTSRVYPIRRLNTLKFTETETRFTLTDGQPVPGASSRGISDEFPLDGHRSLYGATKLASELMLTEYQSMYGLRAVVNRCGVVAGPWQMGKVDQGVFTHWLGAHYFRRPLSYFGYGGTGKQVRDLLHADDLSRLVLWQTENMRKIDRMVFNVGGGPEVSLSLAETTRLCREITGNRVEVSGRKEEREADVRIYTSDISRVREVTGWEPRKAPRDILGDIFEWMRANERELKRALFGSPGLKRA